MGIFSKILKQAAKDWFYAQVPKANTPNDFTEKEIIAGAEYVTITLKYMRISNVRVAFNRFYPAVHSSVQMDFINGKTVEFTAVTTPPKLKELDAKNLDKVIIKDTPLMGPIPYYGGRIQMEMGLLAVQSANLAAPFLSVLKDMSSLGGVSFISAALPYVGPIKAGIDALVSADGNNTSLQIGLAASYDKIKTGYYVIARTEKSKMKGETIYIDADYRLLDSERKPVEDVPYIIFQITSSVRRNDWFMIPEVVALHGSLKESLKTRDKKKINEAFIAFKTAALTTDELLKGDSEKIADEVAADIRSVISKLDKPLFPDEVLGGTRDGKALGMKRATPKKGAKPLSRTASASKPRLQIRELKDINIYKTKRKPGK